jgi:nucleotidyltransferase/DNA polymerase involved in DNA repair
MPVRCRRIACLVIPEFLTDVCKRANPSLADRPIAIADGVARREIVARDRAARAVVIGMTPKQARSACPGLAVVARNEKLEYDATNEVLEALESCGPSVEALRPGVYFFDAGGLPNGESPAIGAAVALVSALGFPAAAAVADDKFTAHCAALTGGVCSIIPPGGSAAFLAPLPVTLLPLAPGDSDRFDMLGLRMLGQIAALATAPLAARFGERARSYATLARGQDSEPLFPRREPTVYGERFEFEAAVTQLEPLFFALRGCLANVAGRLAGAAQVCDKLDIILVCDHQSEAMRESSPTFALPVMLAEPTSSAVVMFDLARVALEAREQLGPVEAIVVRAGPCAQAPPQLGLFDGSKGSRGAALAATLARLHASLTSDEVVTLATQRERSRLPERMQKAVPVTSPRQFATAKKAGEECKTSTWAPALRLIDPPKSIPPPTERTARTGPFRLSESWWERPIDRDYYQLRDRDGALVLAFHDIREDNWYVQGVFD